MRGVWVALGLGLLLAPVPAMARRLDVELWTNRGDDAVYQPGEGVLVKARTNDDAYLLVYEIDPLGSVRVLWPLRGGEGFVEGRRSYLVPPDDSGLELVATEPVGQGFLVAIASEEPFERLPWYLRPYDPQAEGIGYVGEPDDEEGITAEGRIVGDPFVAMERIRRRVLERADDADGFATAYVSYYVHERVRYPRYICNDCHRPGRWNWYAGWDPYYTSCSAFDFRVNWGWSWGPSYWFGSVPYYCFVPRPVWRPRYRTSAPWYSSWNGWSCWTNLWGGHLTRYKTTAPVGYVPPSPKDPSTRWKDPARVPPGLLVGDFARGHRPTVPIGGRQPARPGERDLRGNDGGLGREVRRMPGERAPRDEGDRGFGRGAERPMPRVDRPRDDGSAGEERLRDRGRWDRPREERPAPRVERPRDESPRVERPREERSAPRVERPREESPRYEKPREERPQERPREERAPRVERPREERPAPARDHGGNGKRRDP